MGLSSSKSKTTQNATTTPVNPPWVTEAMQAQTGRVNDFMARDPASLVAGPSALQERAFAGVDNLGGWQAGNQAASTMAQRAGNAGANLANVTTADATRYDAPNLGAANQAANVMLAPTERAQAASLLDNFQLYMDPASAAMRDAAMAEYDADTARQHAALKAQGANAGAFGGSRFGIAEGEFLANQGRGRALTDAQLRSDAFMAAMGLSGQDADRRQNVSLFNAGQENQRNIAQGGMDLQTGLFNTGAQNEFDLARANMTANEGMFNADAANRLAMFNAGAQNTGSMFNASQQDAALQRQLQAAGLTGQLADSAGANSRADLGLTAELGNIQRDIAQAQAYAPAQQLLIGSQALGATPYNLFTGQNVNGTSTTKSSPGIGGILGGVAGAALGGWATGGFR